MHHIFTGILPLLYLFLEEWMTTMLIKWDKEEEQCYSVEPASNGNGVRWWHSCQQPLITQKVWKRKLTLAVWLAAERHYEKNNNLDAIYGPDCCSKRKWLIRLVPGFSPGEGWNPSVTAGSCNPTHPGNHRHLSPLSTGLRPVSGNLRSHPASADYGVPQGSVHGPFLSHIHMVPLWISVDMTLAPPCQWHKAKLSTQLWIQNEWR